MYQTSSAGYLAGYAAAKLSKTGMLGTIIGMDFPTVTDFKVGFDQGAKAANPNVDDPEPGRRHLLRPGQGQGNRAGPDRPGRRRDLPDRRRHRHRRAAGGRMPGKLAVGVDSDQAAIFAATDPAQAEVIFTSVEKKVGQSLYHRAQGHDRRHARNMASPSCSASRKVPSASPRTSTMTKIVPADVRGRGRCSRSRRSRRARSPSTRVMK